MHGFAGLHGTKVPQAEGGSPLWTRPPTNASCQPEKPESSQAETSGSVTTLRVELTPPRNLSSNRRDARPARTRDASFTATTPLTSTNCGKTSSEDIPALMEPSPEDSGCLGAAIARNSVGTVRIALAPHTGHVSNFRGLNGTCELLAGVHGGHPVWTRLELARGK